MGNVQGAIGTKETYKMR